MTPQAVLIDLLERVGTSRGAAVLINDVDLSQWPSIAVKAMKAQKLIVKSRPSRSAVCLGCEQGCVMPVHTMPVRADAPASFIVCNKRNDINRVPVSPEQLSQWRCRADSICKFIAASLGLRRSGKQGESNGLWEIGIATGKKRSQMLCLQVNGELVLVAGNSRVPLAELIEFHDGGYSLDSTMISQLVDAATTTDIRYTPSPSFLVIRRHH